MTPHNHRPTQLMLGIAELDAYLRSGRIRRAVLAVDPALRRSATLDEIVAKLNEIISRPTDVTIQVVDDPGTADDIARLAGRLTGADAVIGLGGGSVIDRVKLASIAVSDESVSRRLLSGGRSGLIVLPPSILRTIPVIAVPTTVGTGTEVSGVACLADNAGKRLVMGAALRPDVAVLDPAATATLPGELVAEGVLEALFRSTGPFVGDHHDQPVEDALIETVATRLLLAGDAVLAARRAGRHPAAELRLDIAKLSVVSHADWLHLGRPPYAVKGWLLANEVSAVCGVRKMTAVASVLPAFWSAVLAGEARWGSASRLRRLWATLRAASDRALPEDPSAGIRALITGWRIGTLTDRREARPGADLSDAVTRRVLRRWGAGLPMLDGLGHREVHSLISVALSGPPPVAGPAVEPRLAEAAA